MDVPTRFPIGYEGTVSTSSRKPLIKDTLDPLQKTFSCDERTVLFKWRTALAFRYKCLLAAKRNYSLLWRDEDGKHLQLSLPLNANVPKDSPIAKTFIQLYKHDSKNDKLITISLFIGKGHLEMSQARVSYKDMIRQPGY